MAGTNSNEVQSKAFAINSLMKNPRLAKILFDSFSAAPGSTKKTKAKNLLKSLQGVNYNYGQTMDGEGGVGPWLSAVGSGVQKFGEGAAEVIGTPMRALERHAMGDQQTPTAQASEPIPSGPMTSMYGPATSTQPGTAAIKGTTPKEPVDTQFLKSVDSLRSLATGIPENVMAKEREEIEKRITSGEFPPEAGYIDQGQQEQRLGEFELIFNYLDQLEDSSSVESWFSGLSEDMKSKYSDVYEAVSSNIGPETWKIQAKSDMDILSKLDLPQSVLDSFAKSGFLSDQKNELFDTLWKENELDAADKRLTNLINRGYTIDTDLENYIKRHDEYLGGIDKMIDDGREKIAYMDTSNPYLNKRADNYMNYLTTLRGRQNTRYMDMLDDSIKYYNAEVKKAENTYNRNFEKFKMVFGLEEGQLTEQYASVDAILGEMYNAVAGIEEAQSKVFDSEYNKFMDMYGLEKRILDVEQARNRRDTVWEIPDAEHVNRVTDILIENFDEYNKTNTAIYLYQRRIWDSVYGSGSFIDEFDPGVWLDENDPSNPYSDLKSADTKTILEQPKPVRIGLVNQALQLPPPDGLLGLDEDEKIRKIGSIFGFGIDEIYKEFDLSPSKDFYKTTK